MSENSTKIHGIYIDIDALMDTRLATLFSVHPDLVGMALNEGYDTRLEESFPLMPRASFKQLYDTRDKSVLKESMMTGILEVLKECVKEALVDSVVSPTTSGARVWLNTYPYKLNKEESDDLAGSLYEKLGETINVSTICESPGSVTPGWCATNLSVMIMYEYQEWLEANNAKFSAHPLPDVTLIAPKIYWDVAPTKEQLEAAKNKFGDPFQTLMMISTQFISLKLMDISLFCAKIK